MLAKEIPEVRWQVGDDLCNCTFQRVGWWTNPYLGRTLEIRMCCLYNKLGEMFPELAVFMREIEAFDDYTKEDHNRPYEDPYHWEFAPRPWSSIDADMPRALWYRQVAAQTGKSLEQIRQEYDHLQPPKAQVPYVIGGKK